MYSFWIIFKQAFKTKAMTKSFMITTLVVVASFFLLANLPSIIDSFDGNDSSQQTLQVVDETGQYTEALQAQLDQQDSAIQLEASALSEEQLRSDVEAGEMEAYLVLEGLDGITARYVASLPLNPLKPLNWKMRSRACRRHVLLSSWSSKKQSLPSCLRRLKWNVKRLPSLPNLKKN